MDLNETLRAAVAEPPPTGIDLDILIKHERRRERRQHWLAGGGIAAGVAAVVGVTAVGFAGSIPVPFAGGGAPPCPVVSPNPIDLKKARASGEPYASGKAGVPVPEGSNGGRPGGGKLDPSQSTTEATTGTSSGPTAGASPGTSTSPGGANAEPTAEPTGPVPTESCGNAARRFNGALTGALHRVAPSAKLTNADDARRTAVWFQQYGDASYIANVVMRDGDRQNGLFVGISTYGRVPTRDQACAKLQNSDGCSYETRPDGTVVVALGFTTVIDAYTAMTEGTPSRALYTTVQVYRPDGTLVSAAVKPWVTDDGRANGSGPGPSASGPATKTKLADPVITPAQLVTIALTPELTLFP